MGARIYNQTTGLFTSTDPIYGGNSTSYSYPRDSINQQDVSGAKAKGCCPKGGGFVIPDNCGEAVFTPTCNAHDDLRQR